MKLNKELLLSVFALQNPSCNIACNNAAMDLIVSLAPRGCTVVRNRGNLLIRKGPASGPHPCFLSHMDQVHDYVPFMRLKIKGGELSAWDGNDVQTGVGGDDKCGIYLALAMLHELDHCTAVFVRDEEVGCIGSGSVPLEWFEHAAFVIQADRNNRTMDIIRDTNGMECASDEFMDAILGLPVAMANKHTENFGTVTDIGELAGRGLRVSMVNISSGYHHPHSSREIVKLDELAIAVELARQASALLGDKRWEHNPESTWDSFVTGKGASKWDDTPKEGGEWWNEDNDDRLAEPFKPTPEREELIDQLVDMGYDREFDQLDKFPTEELEDWIEEEAEAVARMHREEDDR